MFQNLNLIISDFSKLTIFIEVIAVFILVYIINELLAFTNINNAVDTYIFKKPHKIQEGIKLIAAALSTNIDFSNSNFFIDKKFYHQSFLMSTVNLFSILSLELLFLLIFLNVQYINVWASFLIFNFFIFVWIGKRIIDILKSNENNIIVDKNIINFSRIKKSKALKSKYDQKYNLNKKRIFIPLTINFILITTITLIFQFNILTSILFYLILIAIELFIYILFLIYKTQVIKEEELYTALVDAFTYIFDHILLLMLGFVILKTSQILYSVYNTIDINVYLFLIVLIVITFITLFVKNYLFLFTMILPFVLVLFSTDVKVTSFVISFCLYLFYVKNINFKESSSDAIKEVLIVLLGGVICFIVLFYTNLFFAFFIMIIYLILIYFITKERTKLNVEN